MERLTIGIIGCGNMGGAIARGMVKRNVFDKEDIYLYDKDEKKMSGLAEETGCSQGDLSQMVRGSDYLLIAVKPQDFDGLSREIAGDIVDQTIISVMAGVKISAIISALGKKVPAVRVMPNMAAVVSESITCVSYNGIVADTARIKDIFAGIGRVLEVDEKFMDGITALSGSGPAYLFYLADAMMSAGLRTGLDRDTVRELVVQTLYGAAILLRNTGDLPGDLIGKVASRGGTTEAALSVFTDRDLKAIVEDAVWKAKERSEELSKG